MDILTYKHRGSRLPPVRSLRELAAQEVARQVHFVTNGKLPGQIQGNHLMYQLLALDPGATEGFKQARSMAVKRHFDNLTNDDDNTWWHGRARRALHLPDYASKNRYQKLQYVAGNEGTMNQFLKGFKEHPPIPYQITNGVLLPNERFPSDLEKPMSPAFSTFLESRLGIQSSQTPNDVITSLMFNYECTYPAAVVALLELRREFVLGQTVLQTPI